MTALFPGSFDPVTLGHTDIIDRAAALFDRLVVAVMVNNSKRGAFTADERVRLIEKCVGKHKNVEERSYDGLLIDLFKTSGCSVIVRGLRNCAEFEFETQYAHAFKKTDARMETLFMPSAPERAFISSGMAKEVAAFGGDLHLLLPDVIINEVNEKFFGRAVDGNNS